MVDQECQTNFQACPHAWPILIGSHAGIMHNTLFWSQKQCYYASSDKSDNSWEYMEFTNFIHQRS